MATTKLTIEKATKTQGQKIKEIYNHYLDRSNGATIEEMLAAMLFLEILFEGVLVGRGGNHVWIVNKKNERIAIVEFI